MRLRRTAAAVAVLLCLMFLLQTAPVSSAAGETPGTSYRFVSGVVKEINTSLGYITLYRWDGSGTSDNLQNNLSMYRTFSFAYTIPVTRDGSNASPDDVQPGDYAFLLLDDDGYVARLSTRSYYTPVYGKIYMLSSSNIVLKLDDGTYRNIPVPAGVPVYRNNRPVSRSEIHEGDEVRMLVQTNGSSIDVAGIDLLKNPQPVSAIFRGNLEYYDGIRDALVLSNVEEFVNGRWEYSSVMGVRAFTFSRSYKERPSGRISGTAYIAVQPDVNGTESIVKAAIRPSDRYETVFSDNILSVSNTLKKLQLVNSSYVIGFDSDTIAVKDGRLVDVSSLDSMDPVQLSAGKSIGSDSYVSQVIVSNTMSGKGSLAVYRGRIKAVGPLKSFTVESFAELSGTEWSFSNTPKTFGIDLSATRLLTDEGTGNMTEFDENYVNQTVYIVEENGKTLLVSTAPYADEHEKGRVLSLTGSGFVIKEVMKYKYETNVWESASNREITVPENAIVIKNGKITDLSSLRAGDNVHVVSNSSSHDGIIIIVE